MVGESKPDQLPTIKLQCWINSKYY